MKLNTIIQGDCLEVMRGMPDNCVDLVVTSPPYDDLREYNGYSWDFKGVAQELYRIAKEGGVVVWVVGDATINGSETGTSFRQALYFKDVCGFNLHDTMIYHRQAGNPGSGTRYWSNFEYMFVLSKDTPKSVNLICDRKNKYRRMGGDNVRQKDGSVKPGKNGGREFATFGRRENIWYYGVGGCVSSEDKIAFEHPAIFPEKLAKDHIISWSNEGDIVLDPFTGSGTTCKMAERMGRKWIGIELSDGYCEIARKRVEDEKAKFALFEGISA